MWTQNILIFLDFIILGYLISEKLEILLIVFELYTDVTHYTLRVECLMNIIE